MTIFVLMVVSFRVQDDLSELLFGVPAEHREYNDDVAEDTNVLSAINELAQVQLSDDEDEDEDEDGMDAELFARPHVEWDALGAL